MERIYKVIKSTLTKDGEYEITLLAPEGAAVTYTVHEELVLRYRLVKGKELTAAQVRSIDEQLDFGKTYNAALKLLARKDYTVAEMKQKLAAKTFEITLIESAIEKLCEIGLLDDEKYANTYVRHHSLMGKKGPFKIKQELLAKGVLESFIEGALSNFQTDDVLIALGSKLLRKYHSLSEYEQKNKLFQSLMRKGFSYDDILRVYDTLKEELA